MMKLINLFRVLIGSLLIIYMVNAHTDIDPQQQNDVEKIDHHHHHHENQNDDDSAIFQEPAATEYWRPQLHFTPEINWTNDPNGLIYDEIHHVWHLFNQYNPWGNNWGNMSWGHSISFDLVEWIELPVALYIDPINAIFSGSAVMDYKNTSGLCNPNIPPPCLVPIYAGQGKQYQTINLGYSTNPSFTKFDKYIGNPIIPSTWTNFRDPSVFWYKDDNHLEGGWWVLVAARSDISQVNIYTAPNLINWTLTSTFGPAGQPHGWECPGLWPITIKESGRRMWVLTASVNGDLVMYWAGSFDGKTFVEDPIASQTGALRIDLGYDFYAAITYNNVPDDRRVLVGWMTRPGYAGNLPTYPWRGSFSFPRDLSLHNDTDLNGMNYLRLRSTPVKEIEQYRQKHYSLSEPVLVKSSQSPNDQNIIANNLQFGGSRVCELNAFFSFPKPTTGDSLEFGFYFRTNANRDNFTTVGFNLSYPLTDATVYLDRRNSGVVNFDSSFPVIDSTPIPFNYATDSSNNTLSVKILLDTSSIEYFIQDGKVTSGYLIFPLDQTDNDQVVFWVKSGAIQVERLEIWDYQTTSSNTLPQQQRAKDSDSAKSFLERYTQMPKVSTF